MDFTLVLEPVAYRLIAEHWPSSEGLRVKELYFNALESSLELLKR
jgi:hypothetical protein